MKVGLKGSVLLVTLVVLSASLLLIFYYKDKVLDRNRISVFYTEKYLGAKMNALYSMREDENRLCRNFQRERVAWGDYSFSCQCENLFVKMPKAREKYISFSKIEDVLNITLNDENVYFIHSLSELPESSVTDPKVVRVLNAIDERLVKDFYGIMITDYYFDITDKKFYGVLYSSYPNRKDKRNLVNHKQVVDNLSRKCWRWSYLERSKKFG